MSMGRGVAGSVFQREPFLASFEKRKAIGVEQRSTQRGKSHRFVIDAAINGAEYREQTGPCIPAAFENFFGFAAKLHPQCGDGVIGLVTFVSQQQKPALFGGKQEDDPHHDSQSGFVEFSRLDAVEKFAIAIDVGAIERLDQDFDRAPHLFPECVGHLVLKLQGVVEERRQLFAAVDEEAPDAEQIDECLERDGLLPPMPRIPAGECRHRANRRVDEHPLLAVRHEPRRTLVARQSSTIRSPGLAAQPSPLSGSARDTSGP